MSNQAEGLCHMNKNCVIFGDINIDYVADLAHVPLQALDNACINAPIISYVGGNATFFAEAAKEAGFSKTTMIVSLGEDEAANTARQYFKRKGIDLIDIHSNNPTGKVIILYQPNDKRILIADRGSNKDVLLSSKNKLSDYILAPTDLLYISGYIFQNEIGEIALSEVINQYKKTGAFSIIDAVPHEIFQRYQWKDYVHNCHGIDGIVIERDTIIGFMNRPSSECDNDSIADFILSAFNFCIVRLNAKSDFLLADKFNRRVVTIRYQPRVASLRFTDRVIAQVVLRYLCSPDEVFNNSEWVNCVNNMIGEA